MNSWIDLHALWRIVVVGLLCGAGLPAVFALGLRLLAAPAPESLRVVDAGGTPTTTAAVSAGRVRVLTAGGCFAAVLAAIGWGIYLIVAGS